MMISPMFRVCPHLTWWLLATMLFAACAPSGALAAQTVILHLKGGDQVSGVIVSESTNQVVLSNAWAGTLSIPLTEIAKREPTTTATNAAPPAPVLSPNKPSPAVAAVKPTAKAPQKSHGTWHGQVNVGMDAIFGTTDQQSYSGDGQLTYILPYKSNPKKFFRNTVQANGEYQRTDGEESANRAYGSNKSDFDIWNKYYAYALEGVGYDEVQKIDLKYQFGPGAGMHVLQLTNFALDGEAGLSYEVQHRSNAPNLETFYLRLAENFTWKLGKNLKLTEELQFYPDLENLGQYRNDFTSTLSYGFWEHFSWNLTVIDRYDTELSPGVEPNQFELRSSLGFNF